MSDWNEQAVSVSQSAVILMIICKYIGKANVMLKAQLKQEKDQSTSLEFLNEQVRTHLLELDLFHDLVIGHD